MDPIFPLSFSLLKRKYWVHPIQRLCREKGEFHLLIKYYPERFKVYIYIFIFIFCLFHTMFVIQCFVLRDEVDQLAILDFDVRLYGGSELSKHLSKCLLRMRKMQKIKPDPSFFITDESF